MSGPATFVLDGELDIARRAELDLVVEACAAADGDVLLDLRAVTFLDSSGLDAFARITALVGARSGRVLVRGASRRVAMVLELAGLHRLVDLVVDDPQNR